jgi:[acyl-carrier-protein] S-malonyltransferase
MLKDMAGDYPVIKSVFSDASSALGYDLWQLTSEGPSEELDKTIHTQPALLAAAYAIWQVLKDNKNISPTFLAGHSLGEYTALVAAGALSFTDAIKIVAARGRYMQDAVPVGQGALAVVVGLEDDAIEVLCKNAKQGDEVLSPVNFNSPGQIVIGGHIEAVQRALVLAKEAGSKLAKMLPVSVPSHCILMKPAAERLAELLKQTEINKPIIPVLNNVDVAFYENAEAIRDGLTRQLFMPVRWVEIIQKFAKMGVTRIIECGPGKVLTGLNKRIAPEIENMNTADLINLRSLLEIA